VKTSGCCGYGPKWPVKRLEEEDSKILISPKNVDQISLDVGNNIATTKQLK